MFIGREAELSILNEKYGSGKGELVVLYGRRRVGKTETLRQFCRGREHVFYSCVETTGHQQLQLFSAQLLEKDARAAKYLRSFEDWQQAFSSLADDGAPSERKLLVIDEFPYMVKSAPQVTSILQNIWDSELKDRNVMIVLCGSSMSFMEKDVLSEKNPLYGRATAVVEMKPMGFFDAAKFLPDYSRAEQVLAYSILGGTPYYLAQFDDTKAVGENIKYNILRKGCVLFSEVEFLIRQELREPGVYNSIIEAVALGGTQLNEIHQKTLVEKNKLTAYIKNLMELGVMRREFPASAGAKERANAQRGLYRLTDNYFRFWYAFIFPNKSELEAGDVNGIYEHAVEPYLDSYASFIFEDVCIEYLRRRNVAESLPFHFTGIGRWWSGATEIDILASDHAKKRFLIAECKYRKTPFSAAQYEALKGKQTPADSFERHYVLFSKSGFTPELRKIAAAEGTELVSLGDMV